MFCTLTQALIPFPLSRCQSPSRSAVVVELTCELQGNWEAPPIPQVIADEPLNSATCLISPVAAAGSLLLALSAAFENVTVPTSLSPTLPHFVRNCSASFLSLLPYTLLLPLVVFLLFLAPFPPFPLSPSLPHPPPSSSFPAQLQECIKPEECITRKRKQQEREMEERNSSEGTNPWLERTAWQPDRQPRAAGTAVSKATR
ncbi:unnamed protein product [Closterium sp. NIES-64]|nr:unnamed protein product [Closterium sp. NIES-64]